MASIGYATLQVIPSFAGFTAKVNRELDGTEKLMRARLGAVGASSGVAAGDRFGSSFGSRIGTVAKAAGAALAVGLGIGTVAATKFGFESAAMFEQARISMNALTGSTEKGGKTLKELAEFAAATPFQIPGLLDASRQLLAVGVSAEDLIPTLTKIGNVAAILGQPQEAIDRAIRAISQTIGKGKLQAEEMRQITEALPGFSTIKAIAEALGTDTATAFKQVERGAVPADFAVKAILASMEKFPGAAGAMERQSQTLSGTLSLLKDTLRIALAEGLQPILPELTKTIREAAPAIGKLLSGVSVAVGRFATTLIGPLTSALAVIGPAIAPLLSAVGSGLGAILNAITPSLNALAPSFRALAPIIGAFAKALAPIAATLAKVGVIVAQTVIRALNALAPAFGALFGAIRPLLPVFVQLAESIGDALVANLAELAPALTEVATALGGALAEAIGTLAPVLPDLVKSLGDVAVIFAEGLALGLVALRPALPALAELIKLGAQLIAALPPQALAAIVAGILAFRGINAVSKSVESVATSFARLSTRITKFSAGDPTVNAFTRITSNSEKIKKSLKAATDSIVGYVRTTFESSARGASKVSLALRNAGSALLGYGRSLANVAIQSARAVAAWTVMNARLIATNVATIAVAVAQGAITVATKLWTAAQIALNVALTANPIGLIVVGIAALVAAVVLAYQNIEIFRNAIDATIGFIVDNWPIALAVLTGGLSIVAALVINNWDTIRNAFSSALTFISGVVSGWVGFYVGIWTNVWNIAVSAVTRAWSLISSIVSSGVNLIRSIITSWFGFVTSAWSAFWRTLVSAVDILREMPSRIASILADVRDFMFDIGRDIVTGFIDGIKSIWGEVEDLLGDLADKLPGVVKSVLGISSPSRVFMEIGRAIPEGMAAGIDDAIPEVNRSLIAMFQAGRAVASNELLNFEQLGTLMGDATVKGFAASASQVAQPFLDRLPDVGNLLTNLDEGVDLSGITKTLTDAQGEVVTFIDGLSNLVAQKKPVLAAQTAALGVEQGSALIKAYQAASPQVQGEFDLVVAGLEQSIAAARQKSLEFIPAFADSGVSLSTALNKNFADSINLASISLAEVGETVRVIATNTNLLQAGAFKGNQVTEGYRSALKLQDVTDTQIADAAALVRLNKALPEGHKILSENATLAYQQGLQLVGVTPAQLEQVAFAVRDDTRIQENVRFLAERVKAEFGKGVDFLSITAENVSRTAAFIQNDATLPSSGLVKGGEVTGGFRQALALEGVSRDNILEANLIFAADRSLGVGAQTLSGNATVAYAQALLLAGVTGEELNRAIATFERQELITRARTAGINIGHALAIGVGDGIDQETDHINGASARAIAAANRAMQQVANANSPSRLTRDQVGKPLGEGVAVGILDEIPGIAAAGASAVRAARDGAKTGLSATLALLASVGGQIRESFVQPLQADEGRFSATGAGLMSSFAEGIRETGSEVLAAIDLRPAGESTIERFSAGLAGGLATVRDLLAQTETFVRPPDLAPVGTRIMATLTEGLNAGIAQVRAALAGLSALVGSASFAFAAPPDPAPILLALTAISERLRSAITDPLGLGGPSTVFATYGAQLVAGLTLGIASGAEAAVAVVTDLATRLAVPLPALQFAGVDAITADELEDRFTPAFNWIRSLPRRVADLLPAGWLDLTGEVDTAALALQASLPVVTAPFEGLPGRLAIAMTEGVRSGLDLVGEFVTDLGAALTIPETDLRPAGQLVMRDFRLGLDDELTNVRSLFEQLGVLSVTLPNLESLGRGWIDTLTAGVSSGFDPLRDVLGDTATLFADTELSATPIDLPAPAVSQADLRALAEIRVQSSATEVPTQTGPAVVIEQLNAWNAREAAEAITDEQNWRARTGGRV